MVLRLKELLGQIFHGQLCRVELAILVAFARSKLAIIGGAPAEIAIDKKEGYIAAICGIRPTKI